MKHFSTQANTGSLSASFTLLGWVGLGGLGWLAGGFKRQEAWCGGKAFHSVFFLLSHFFSDFSPGLGKLGDADCRCAENQQLVLAALH